MLVWQPSRTRILLRRPLCSPLFHNLNDLSFPLVVVQIVRAYMYVHFSYAHKASACTTDECPWYQHEGQLHMVLKEWEETQATSGVRLTG